MISNSISTLTPANKYFPALNNASVRMAPEGSEYEGWLDLGDAVAIAYGPSDGYAGAVDPKDAAQKLISKVRETIGRIHGHVHTRNRALRHSGGVLGFHNRTHTCACTYEKPSTRSF